MWLEILFLLLPVAAFSGWLVGRRPFRSISKTKYTFPELSTEYFKGLNYLLNEQPDKALDIFIRMIEVDSETVETHFALANLFLRRGEVDRAIRIHQNLIARPTLSREHHTQALFELGRDYTRAGLLDRAERLFQKLSDDSAYGDQALQQLRLIYEQEREWYKAMDIAERLIARNHSEITATLAHYYCEMAIPLIANNERSQAQRMLKKALEVDRCCVRATLLGAQIAINEQDYRQSIQILKRVERQNTDFLPEIIPQLMECHQKLDRIDELDSYVDHLLHHFTDSSLVIAKADLLNRRVGSKQAIDFLLHSLQYHPSVRGIDHLLQIKLNAGDTNHNEDTQVLSQLTQRILTERPIYQCSHCGLGLKSLSWHCPGCKSWGTISPIHGLVGE